jgi:hypothetical protein
MSSAFKKMLGDVNLNFESPDFLKSHQPGYVDPSIYFAFQYGN